MLRLVYVVTHPGSADTLLRGQLGFMRERGFDVTVVSAPGPELDRVAAREGVRAVAVRMDRPIRLGRDARALAELTRVLRELRPDIVNASTPKAGLLGTIAARATSVPLCVYLVRGLRGELARGSMRQVLATTERVASRCAHDVVCVSESLRRLYVAEDLAPSRKVRVVGPGSSNGVDADRFARSPEKESAGRRHLAQHGISPHDEVIGFVGRMHVDKGIAELIEAFELLKIERPRARLLLVGAGMMGDRDEATAVRAQRAGAIMIDHTDDLPPWYAAMKVLAFPSHREGFPNVPLEAACASLPVVGFPSTGVVDAVVDGQTGTLVPRGDVRALARALARYLADEELRLAHGSAGARRARESFSRNAVWTAWESYYRTRHAELRGQSH